MTNIRNSNSTQHKLGSLKLYVHIHVVNIHNYAADIYKSQECVVINWPPFKSYFCVVFGALS